MQSSLLFVLNLVSAIRGYTIGDLVIKTCTQLWHRPYDLTCMFTSIIELADRLEHGQKGWSKIPSHNVLAANKIHQHIHLFFTLPQWFLPACLWPGQTANQASSQPFSQPSAPKLSLYLIINSKLEKKLLIAILTPFVSISHILNSIMNIFFYVCLFLPVNLELLWEHNKNLLCNLLTFCECLCLVCIMVQ